MTKGLFIAGAILVAALTSAVALQRSSAVRATPAGSDTTPAVARDSASVTLPALATAPVTPDPSASPTHPPRATSPSVGSRPAPAVSGMRSTRDGVYTEAQATAGRTLYNDLCNSCHAPLQNHIGPVFRRSWGGSTVNDLMDYMAAEMPKNDPGSLSATDYAAVIAYLLKLNGMPAGATPLGADAASLRQIRIDTVGQGTGHWAP